jgi:integrase
MKTRKKQETVHLTKTYIDGLEKRAKYYDTHDDEISGLAVRVEVSGKKIYRLRYKLPDGTRRAISIGDAAVLTPTQARDAAKRHWADAVRGDDPLSVKEAARAHTLKSFLDEVYITKTTIKTAKQTVERIKQAFPGLLTKRLGEIRPMWVESWRKTRQDKGTAKSTTNRDLDALRGVLTKAVDWGFLDEHPLKRVKKDKLDDATKPRFLNVEELKQLHKALDAREQEARDKRARFNKWRKGRSMSTFPDLSKLPFTDHLKPMTLLALNTGMRRGEIFQLKWDDVVLDGAAPSLVIHGANAKGGRTRHVPLNAVALDTLTRWKTQTGGTGLVFQSPKGGGQFGHIRRAWADLMKDANLPDFRFHDCRHHFASMLVQKGVDLNMVRELLGHSDLKLTLRYAHLSPKSKAAAVQLLDTPANVVPMQMEGTK